MMKGGFLIGATAYVLLTPSAQPVQWVEYADERKVFSGEWVKVNRAEKHQITTYRCEGCGYLESYAHEA
jgi:hypothetical protein